MTDAIGTVVERYRYSAFGKVEVLNPDFTAKAGNLPVQSYTYTGREWEPEAGLYFNRARFYCPELGRFISRDPIGEKGGINLYGYVGNDALDSTDPKGTDTYGHDIQDTMAGFIDGFIPGLPYDEHNDAMRIGRRVGRDTNLALAIYGLPNLGRSLVSFVRNALSGASLAADGAAQVATQLEFNFAKDFGQTSGLAIGRGADLSVPAALGASEYKLGWLSVEATSGGVDAEWAVNEAKLRSIMNFNLPIRDVSTLLDTGGRYLNLERGLLQSAGWSYQGGYWVPPAP